MIPICLQTLCDLVQEARPLVVDRDLASHVREKGAADFVTQADTAVESFIKERLQQICPECRFMGEEEKDHVLDPSAFTFILDPIDGTTNLVHGYPMSAISLALTQGGKPLMGVVYNPFSEELFSAEKGCGAFLNGKPIRVSDTPDLPHAVVSIGTAPYFKNVSGGFFPLFQQLFLHCVDIRRIASAALDGCFIASGRQDVYLEYGLRPWDCAAAILLITEAGGTVTDWQGNPVRLDKEYLQVVYSNGRLHETILEFIQKYAPAQSLTP